MDADLPDGPGPVDPDPVVDWRDAVLHASPPPALTTVGPRFAVVHEGGRVRRYDDLAPDTIAWTQTGNSDDAVMKSVGTAAPTMVWSCLDWVVTSDIARSPDRPSQESCGSNALAYDDARNTYTISLWSHETVLEMDPDNGEVLWYADPGGRHGYTLANGAPEWHWQHEAQMLGPDRLLLSSGVNPQRDGSFEATAG